MPIADEDARTNAAHVVDLQRAHPTRLNSGIQRKLQR
jgi:hypothetical protein